MYGLCGLQSCYKLKEGVAESQAATEDDYEFIADKNCQLGECNMAEKDWEMAYFFSDNWPYVPPCLKGQVSFINGGIYPWNRERKEKFDRHGEFNLINIFVNKWGLSWSDWRNYRYPPQQNVKQILVHYKIKLHISIISTGATISLYIVWQHFRAKEYAQEGILKVRTES